MAEKKTTRKTVKVEGPTIDSIPLVYRHRIPIGKTITYWEGLRNGRVYATRCKGCGSVFYPPQTDCPYCGSNDVEWFELPGEGVIETFTRVYSKPQGYEDFEPYIITIVNVGNGVKVMGWLMGVKDERCVKVGDEVIIETTYIEKHNKYIITFRLKDKKC
ncbi:Zn-ribbon domain-containing OB-fold protein [Vulcanisaeta thermophila]|uniref:Zn-ribbon domain-containing OB-fold protein n=1 Tax=Vulcanisaeta thermophila TaxID=867917 RepID=UPI0008535EA6|nr:Zn-ribbon domain-containing OB-fold protein [Vulcanisaeta thermophila]